MSRLKLLVITPYPPFAPGGDGATTRVFSQLGILSEVAELYVIAYVRKHFEKDLDKINQFEEKTAGFELISESTLGESKRDFAYLRKKLTRVPGSISLFEPAKKAIKIKMQGCLHANSIDAVQVEHSYFGELLKDVDRSIVKVVDFMDIYTDIAKHKYKAFEGISQKVNYWVKYQHTRRIEKKALAYSDAAIVMSEDDRVSLANLNNKKRIIVAPNGVDDGLLRYSGKTTSKTTNILFMGTFTYYPMREAMVYVIESLLPSLAGRMRKEAYKMTFVGPVNEADREKYGRDNVLFTGRTSEVARHINDATICINPIRFGSGTCLKVLEYSACGKATIATPKGAEGLEMVSGKNLIVAEREAFADQIVKLLRDHDFRQTIAENAHEFVSQNYTWERTTRPLVEYYLNGRQ
jgi:glycosyltransferase involved in cell wall biosynthesis